MTWHKFGLGGFAQSFLLLLKRKITVFYKNDKNINKFHFAVYILIFDPSLVSQNSNCIASASSANPLHLHQSTQLKNPLHCH